MSDTIDAGQARLAMIEAVQSAFADMAFIDVAALPALPATLPSDKAAIDMLKPLSLRLEISSSPGLRARISDILFGTDNERDKDDAFLELVNVAAGVFLSKYYGAKSEVRLELPRYLYETDEEEGSLISELGMDAEGEPLVVALRSMRYRY
jgi:hypothetical protein